MVVEKSDRKYAIPVGDVDDSQKITLVNQLSVMSPFTRVTCEAKVL